MTDQADSHIRVDMRNTGSPGNEYVLALCETMIPMTMNTDIRFHCICGLQLKYLLCRNTRATLSRESRITANILNSKIFARRLVYISDTGRRCQVQGETLNPWLSCTERLEVTDGCRKEETKAEQEEK